MRWRGGPLLACAGKSQDELKRSLTQEYQLKVQELEQKCTYYEGELLKIKDLERQIVEFIPKVKELES